MIVAAKGLPPLRIFFLGILCMVAARTAGMAFNRYLDADLDARNPRTANREIPRGLLSRRFALGLSIGSAILLVLLTSLLNTLCFRLVPVALFFLFFYSFTKRFTDFSHLFLGVVLGIVPVAAWIAITGHFSGPPVFLGLAVTFWVAGFDTLYAMQDLEFDRREGLHSLVVRLGPTGALRVARWFHVVTLGLFIAFGILTQERWPYYLALGICSLLLYREHRMVTPTNLSRLNAAFFNMNGSVSVIFLLGVALSVL